MPAPLYRDITGERFTRLTAIQRAGRDDYNRPLWVCECDCGGTTILVETVLVRGVVHSCGCLIKDTAIQAFGVNRTGQRFGDSVCMFDPVEGGTQRVIELKCDCEQVFSAELGSVRANSLRYEMPTCCPKCKARYSQLKARTLAASKNKYLGVAPNKKRWLGYIDIEGKRIFKTLDTQAEAARWRDEQAVKYYGEWAVLNFPPDES